MGEDRRDPRPARCHMSTHVTRCSHTLRECVKEEVTAENRPGSGGREVEPAKTDAPGEKHIVCTLSKICLFYDKLSCGCGEGGRIRTYGQPGNSLYEACSITARLRTSPFHLVLSLIAEKLVSTTWADRSFSRAIPRTTLLHPESIWNARTAV